MRTKRKTSGIVTTMNGAAKILNHPLWIVQEAKLSGCCLAFKRSGRVDVDELRDWLDNSWGEMPPPVFDHFLTEWRRNVWPTLRQPLGISPSVEDACERMGLSLSLFANVVSAYQKAKP